MDILPVKANGVSTRAKVSELRERFEYIKASFAVEGIYFDEEELRTIETSIRKRHRAPGLLSSVKALLESKTRK